jgi:hypothetical protein
MSTRSERKSAFSVLGLLQGFFQEAEKLGVTPEQIQAIRESPNHMVGFASFAKRAEEDRAQRIAHLQHERECAVDIDGVHYHVVVVSLANAGCATDSTLGEMLEYARSQSLIQLKPEAYEKAHSVVASISSRGLWLAGVEIKTNIYGWRQLGHETAKVEYCGDITMMTTKLSEFPTDLLGFLFLMDCGGCDYEQT